MPEGTAPARQAPPRPLGRSGRVGPNETNQLVAALMQALERKGHIDGSRLLDLMRMERHLQESLRIVRREIAAIVEQTMPPLDEI